MKTFLACITLAFMTTLAFPALADDHSTLRVVSVQTDDVERYIAQLKIGNKLIRAQDPKWTMSAFEATFAGPNTGSVVVAVQYPGDLSDFARAWEANMGNEEISEWLAGLSELRTIVSDSVYVEHPLD